MNTLPEHQVSIRISEIYLSKQGEGLLTGTPSWFIRTSGCNLRCWFCDTPYTSWKPEGKFSSLESILNQLDSNQAKHVVLTGGEPMLPRPVVELTRRLNELDFHITIETAGTLYRPVRCDLMSVSPKLANSTPDFSKAGAWSGRHEGTRHQPDIIKRLVAEYPYQIKFVADQPEDCQAILDYLDGFPEIDRARVLLMPQGIEQNQLVKKEAWLEPFCQENSFKLCRRKHIEWYGNKRGT